MRRKAIRTGKAIYRNICLDIYILHGRMGVEGHTSSEAYMNEQITEVERVFMAFADKTRLQLLYLLRNGEVSVNSLCESLNTSQPKVSRHLAYLRTMNMVTTRRDGKSIFYRLDPPSNHFGASVIEETIDWLDSFSGVSRRRNRPKPERQPPAPVPVERPLFTYREEAEPAPSVMHEPETVEQEMEVYLL